MKNAKKVLLLVLCAALLVSASIAGTVAYLTSKATVTNTFTAGKVVITMDEAKTNEYGVKDGDNRVAGNKYLLVPGHNYLKDPIVHVNAESESCYVYVKITNEIATLIDVTALESQLSGNGWAKLDSAGNVWYQTYDKDQADKELEVFENFTVLTDADTKDAWNTITAATKIEVVAYAIQKDTLGTASAAWTALNNQLNPPANS